ncbi:MULTISPECIES: GNAT family N-acetyltransferase [Erwinia]|uniref:Acetyltransferase GCN5 n=1 Tax=Erwinia rhapontici TaxID=55212 RepID=A0ABN6DH60_ERWRD|nr:MULTISPECIES: GNAT family N-acetyltransferase [Erwinia]MCS3605071.1 phosphinothricin acetyltransferase [Erwinia rhapontici]NNS08381.1 N-acetyltransferase [Erwinia sp. JH02]BCQ34004.1 acetyltransferase GCN5 [Erwinia rhapontici]
MSLSSSEPIVRDATPGDIDAMTRIYSWHVLHGCGSFEETPPDATEMAARHQKVCSFELPWLVAEIDGQVVGYCYATQYRPRPAYRFTVEDSVYIDAEMGGRGIGSALLAALIVRCQQGPYRQMLAIIGNGERNAGSLNLHKKMGFEIVGNFRAVGFKHGEWRDTLLMQRAL